MLLLESQSALDQVLDLILDLLIGGPRSAAYEAVVGVISRVHRPGVIEVVHQDNREQMVHREGIVGMLFNQLLEFLRGAVIVHVVEVLESYIGERVFWGAMECFLSGL